MSWNKLTERQKYLDKAIETCGIPTHALSLTVSCVREVMKRVGASSQEESFVRERIALRLKAANVMQATDSFIDSTNAQLDRFAEDDKRWEQRLNAFGIHLRK